MRPEIIVFCGILGFLVYKRFRKPTKLNPKKPKDSSSEEKEKVKTPPSKWILPLGATIFVVVFLGGSIWLTVNKYMDWQDVREQRQIFQKQQAKKLKKSNSVEVFKFNPTAYPERWGGKLVPVKPGYDMTIQTIPKGQSVEVMVRTENGSEYDGFSLGSERNIEKPKKVLTPGKKFYLDFRSRESHPVDIVVYEFPIRKK